MKIKKIWIYDWIELNIYKIEIYLYLSQKFVLVYCCLKHASNDFISDVALSSLMITAIPVFVFYFTGQC